MHLNQNLLREVNTDGVQLRAADSRRAVSVSIRGCVIAVGCGYNGSIILYDHDTFEQVRVIAGTRGGAPGEIGHYVQGLCFSPDGSRVLVAELTNPRASVFGTDGTFVTCFGTDVIHCCSDVRVTSTGHVLVADIRANCLHVFSLEDFRYIHSWTYNDAGVPHDVLYTPASIAISGAYLYVLPVNSARIHVFQ